MKQPGAGKVPGCDANRKRKGGDAGDLVCDRVFPDSHCPESVRHSRGNVTDAVLRAAVLFIRGVVYAVTVLEERR